MSQSNASRGKQDIMRRLRRLEGQVRGLQNMIAEERECAEILTQFLAARAALDAIGAHIIDEEMRRCLAQPAGNQNNLSELMRLWLRIGPRIGASAQGHESDVVKD